jgi:excisionase family DNA binding protein
MQDDETRLRAQGRRALMQMHALAVSLLSYGTALPRELRIHLDTFSADLAAAIEDVTGARPASTSPADMSFLTVTEIADLARVSKMTIYRLIKDGELDAIRMGSIFRIPQAAARKLLGEIPQPPGEGPYGKECPDR